MPSRPAEQMYCYLQAAHHQTVFLKCALVKLSPGNLSHEKGCPSTSTGPAILISFFVCSVAVAHSFTDVPSNSESDNGKPVKEIKLFTVYPDPEGGSADFHGVQAGKRVPRINGKLLDERFSKLSKSYEDEQRTLNEKAKTLHAELDKEQTQAVNVAQFIALVKKYSEIDTLASVIVNEFIERINVHAPDKSSGHRSQQIDIAYNFIGILPTPQAKEEAA
ncbi:MAG: DUF4368 domain-containing protein [Oscillospiraceae bacterium]|jgi:hypothetical protein|nr:DUF4368 domain-containing protein [Oscillospiraceae bacterium]